MAQRIRYVRNDAGIKELLKSSGVEADLVRRAEAAAAAARAGGPQDSGEYVDGIEVEAEQHSDRVVAKVVAKAPHSSHVEANTGNLARSLDAAAG
jgi:hypothetical protein